VFYGRVGTSLVAPGSGQHNVAVVPRCHVAGGPVIGLMARFASHKIRGHGMPEAIESILLGSILLGSSLLGSSLLGSSLLGGSKIVARVAGLKLVSAAIAIVGSRNTDLYGCDAANSDASDATVRQ
jgi:chloride channel protein, CIC family